MNKKDSKAVCLYRTKTVIKVIAFFAAFVFLLTAVSNILTSNFDDMEAQLITGIRNEPAGSLDAVYIGSSSVYTFWNSLAAWNAYGITVYPFCCSSLPLSMAEYYIREARKDHPDAVYIININTLGEEALSDAVMHRLLDNMPLSADKLKFTYKMTKTAGLTFSESLEYYLPLLRFHSRWSELNVNDIIGASDYVDKKNCITYWSYYGGIYDITSAYNTSDEYSDVTDSLKNDLDSLLDYCDSENVKAVFVTVPRAEEDVETVQKFNTVNKIISERGYPTVELLDDPEALGLDLSIDYYDNTHTNIHGSFKFTYYLSEYLVQNYGLTDKRGDQYYSSWDTAFEAYWENYHPHILDFELESGNRDFGISQVNELSFQKDGEDKLLTWEASDGADGYAVYRKKDDIWTHLCDTEETKFVDEDAEEWYGYVYRVVPYRIKDGKKFYGEFSYEGIYVDWRGNMK